jgi:hypothetical protein
MKQRPFSNEYQDYAPHPRYGKEPRFTGFDPDVTSSSVHLHWNTRCFSAKQIRLIERIVGGSVEGLLDDGTRRVSGTAVAADLTRQTPSTVAVTHYYDLDKVCRDCGRRFIFFAEEQKHWYEDLGFPLEAEAVRCPQCRKRIQQIARWKRRYEQLYRASGRTPEDVFEMAECGLLLMEEGVFSPRCAERILGVVNGILEDQRSGQQWTDIRVRLRNFVLGKSTEARKG